MSFGTYKTLALLTNEKVWSYGTFLDCEILKKVKAKAFPVAKESDRVSEWPLALVHINIIGSYPKKVILVTGLG